MAACAAYAAVLRYATRGRDEYPIAPRNVNELRAVLCVPILSGFPSRFSSHTLLLLFLIAPLVFPVDPRN